MALRSGDSSLQLVSAVLDESDHFLLLAERSGRVVYANPSTCERLGLGGSWNLVPEAFAREILVPNLDAALLGLESGDCGVRLNLRYDGRLISARARLLPQSNWLLLCLDAAGENAETKEQIPIPVHQELVGVPSNGNGAVHGGVLESASSEGEEAICEAIGEGLYFLACSPEMKKISKQAHQIASVNVPVLITGESGSGKEVVARMIHQRCLVRKGPFVKVNCAALPSELLESELFGFEQGAFTGAVRAKPGKFELADRGTIFLDEIAEMDTHLQSKLLHVLQDGRFSRLGSRHMVKVDVRVIAATNVAIQEAIRDGRFREDLYYRLNVFPCHLPPLRERPAEIPILFRLFFERCCREFGKELAVPGQIFMDAVQHYAWPGNVRELENFVKRYVILADEEESLQELLEMAASQKNTSEESVNGNSNGHKAQTLKSLVRGLKDEAEMRAIADALKQTNWRRKDAARILGISYKALLYKMRQFGFSPSNGHSSGEMIV